MANAAPYLALRRFHGVFAPNHHLRSLVVPTPCTGGAVPVAPKRPGRMNRGRAPGPALSS